MDRSGTSFKQGGPVMGMGMGMGMGSPAVVQGSCCGPGGPAVVQGAWGHVGAWLGALGPEVPL